MDEEFIVANVANVTNPLLSLGRLLKHGWTFGAKEEKDWNFVNENLHGKCAGILVSPDKECRIPVFYKRNSLSVLACVRRVETTVHSIRGVTVTFKMDVSKLVEGWQFYKTEILVIWQCHETIMTSQLPLALLGNSERPLQELAIIGRSSNFVRRQHQRMTIPYQV